jgi:hypothetical protein
MEILKTSKQLTTKEKYFLTMAPNAQKMKDAVSQRVEITAFCLYTDTNAKGEVQEILSIMTPEDEVFATISPTFKEDFFKLVDLFADNGETVNSIVVTSGTSKAGREFITCVYVD